MASKPLTPAERGRLGGKATAAKYGSKHYQEIGRKGQQVTTEKYFDGNARLHHEWLAAAGAAAQDDLSGYQTAGFWYVSEATDHPAHKEQ